MIRDTCTRSQYYIFKYIFFDARMECQVLLLSSGRNCQMVEVSNVSCCQIDDLSNPNGGWRNCKQKEVSNGGSVK